MGEMVVAGQNRKLDFSNLGTSVSCVLMAGVQRRTPRKTRVVMHPVCLIVAFAWTCAVVLASLAGDLSASAGILPKTWCNAGMGVGFVSAALVVVGMCYLPAGLPAIVRRLLQLVGMAGAFWAAGTLTRAIYVLTA